MRKLIYMLAPALLLVTLPVSAAEITGLADCAIKVFAEINRTQKWSGKPPGSCKASVAVEKRQEGVFVTVWSTTPVVGGWVRAALSSAAGYAELADKKELEKANGDVMARATRLERCLESILTDNDPRECRVRATKSYSVGDVIGTENDRLIWLDDEGRHTVVEYTFGDASAPPTPPADLFEGAPLPPGATLLLHRKI